MNKIFFFALLSISAQPAQSMSKMRYAQYSSTNSSYQNPLASLNSDTLLIGGAVVAATGVFYWLYRSNYKSSLAEAHTSLDAAQSAMQELVKSYDESANPGAETFADIQNLEAASSAQRQLVRDSQTAHDLVIETRRHAETWRGYKDYRHTEAEALIQAGNELTKQLASLRKDLNHRIATFALQDGTIEAMAQAYSVGYNPLVNITSLEMAYNYQRQFTADAKTVQEIIAATRSYMAEWKNHKHNRYAQAFVLLNQSIQVQANMHSIQASLTAMIAEYELEYCVKATEATFRSYLNLLAQPDQLKQKINGAYHKEAYSLLAFTTVVEQARENLGKKTVAVTNPQYSFKDLSDVLLGELHMLIGTVANMPEYTIEKNNKRIADATREESLAQERRAREERELKERIARQERESQERRAREDREAKERHDRAMLEQQRRLTRAKEQEAAAATEKAEAERRKARVEEERLRLERQRLELERQKLAQQPATNTINITVKKNSDDLY